MTESVRRSVQRMTESGVFASRYDVSGPPNGCKGQCEGTGWVPIEKGETDPVYRALWQKAEEKEPTDDGWHFVPCPDCRPGEALTKPSPRMERLLRRRVGAPE